MGTSKIPLPIQLPLKSPLFLVDFVVDIWRSQGNKYGPERIAYHKNLNALKHEVFLDDCADAYVLLAKNTSMTGAKITVDSGANISAA